MSKLSIGSLFAGIGGIEYGLEMTGGFVTKWQVETDAFCRSVLRRHWPTALRCGAIEKFPAEPISRWNCDIITGGFPCQPVSLAGKRKGKTDERWLWTEMHRVCEVLRPRWILGENVRGLLSADDRRLFGAVLKDLADMGYDAEWRCLSAASVGAAHLRQRLFIVAHPTSTGLDGHFPILGGPDGQGPSIRTRWDSEPNVDRVVHGLSSGLDVKDRLRCLGNAVVPQVTRWIGKRILEYEQWRKKPSSANTSPNSKPI